MLGIGVIGYGYWGPNLVRNFGELPDVRVISVCDLDPLRLEVARRQAPGSEVTGRFVDLLADPRIDAIALATPVSTHGRLGLAVLRADKHLLIEKPLAASVAEAEELVDEAERRGLILMVDHTFLYTPAVQTMRELVRSGALGELYYFDSVRVNLGLFQHDVNVLWDLAVHDLAILDDILPETPSAVSAVGVAHVPGEPENQAYVTLFYRSRFIAHIHVNWLAPVKLRSTLLSGSQRMLVYNDLEPSEKLKIYDRGITLASDTDAVHRLRVNYRSGDMTAPHLETAEALTTEVSHFVDCIRTGKAPRSDGRSGLRIVRWLEAASCSLSLRGTPVVLCEEVASL